MKRIKKIGIIINMVLIVMILGLIIWILIEEAEENKIVQKVRVPNYSTEQLNAKENIKVEEKQEKIYPKEAIEKEYKGYTVSSKLEIPAIELETYVLQKYSKQALNISVTKFWGANANQVGNYCIAGHNFQNKNMFYHIKKLNIGDRFFISDNNVGKVEYEIYNIYQVIPEDVSCLSQDTKGKREATLITCTNDSEKRIIVKAKEIE